MNNDNNLRAILENGAKDDKNRLDKNDSLDSAHCTFFDEKSSVKHPYSSNDNSNSADAVIIMYYM